ncbi:hypothetical protein TVAG_003660 [Trichomonas vaginalis G3]|uniref:Uncharacterized protein n=1 Tax=Trichomonas vaginalis (strain ATCC PRA-98 / G3) TaxID=412133 RepID=A2E580_TRIV3|nr:hypothetical protein TVAGG3_0472130 [Trichomonas vaginalis G3]EAY12160.1 hypothetical protein TVAG_003660 [Trichomonas vaginalis G3]KAI5515139.1 hypothetical protein TVAGG3_0472130 [Trichomonas vaginalis G3]|eukprot:XP_001324383.1 hypothetical protein [Trichomonas vaginalis G3]
MFWILFLADRQITTDWSQFASEDMLVSACEVCDLVVDKFRKGEINDLLPQNNTECADSSTTNPYCGLIKNITSDINATFKNKIPRNACEIISPCVSFSQKEFTGELCYPCRFLYHFSIMVNVTDKVQFIKRFCTTTRSTFAALCSRIESDNTGKFWNNLQKSKNSLQQCYPFCRKAEDRQARMKRSHRFDREL